MEPYPVRRQNESTASYDSRVQDWRAHNTLPVARVSAEPEPSINVLNARQPKGTHTNKPPSPNAVLPES